MSATSVEFCAKVAVAVEISGAKWMVGSFAGTKLRRKVLEEKSATARLAALCVEVRAAAAKLGGEGAQVVVAYEAGHEGFWIQRALVERGFQAEVIDPASLKVDRRSKRAKTDRLDAEALNGALYGKHGCARCPPVVPLCCAGARLGAGPGRSLHPRAPMRISP